MPLESTQDVPCKGSRFNNVISSNTIYVGQTNDTQPAKCPKTCAQRGSWANPATSTTEALALALEYFGTNPTILLYGAGTYDTNAGPSAGSIVFPYNISIRGTGSGEAGTRLNYSGGYSFTGVPEPAKEKIASLQLMEVEPPAKVGSVQFMTPVVVGGWGNTTAVDFTRVSIHTNNAAAAVDFSKVSIKTNNGDVPSLSVIAAGGGSTSVNFTSGSIVNSAAGGTVLSSTAGDSGQNEVTLSDSKISAPNGTLSSIRASGSGQINFTSRGNLWEDSLGNISSSPVSAFITELTESASAHLTIMGDTTKLDVVDGTPACLFNISDRTRLTLNHQGGEYTNYGPGVYSQGLCSDDSILVKIATNNSFQVGGPKLNWTYGSSKPTLNTSSGNTVNYTGSTPLSMPFYQTYITGPGGLSISTRNNTTNAATQAGVPANSFVNMSGGKLNMDRQGSSLTNTGNGGGYNVENQGNGSVSASISNTIVSTAGDAPALYTQAMDGGGTTEVTSQGNQYNQALAATDGLSAKGPAILALLVLIGLGADANAVSDNAAGVSSTFNVKSQNDLFTAAGVEPVVGIFINHNSRISNLVANVSNPYFSVPLGTCLQSSASGSGSTSVTATNSIINSAQKFITATSTGDADHFVTASATAISPDSGVGQLVDANSDSSAPLGVTFTGVNFTGTTGGLPFMKWGGNVDGNLSQFDVAVIGTYDQILKGDSLTGNSTMTSCRLSKKDEGIQEPTALPLVEMGASAGAPAALTVSDSTMSTSIGPVAALSGWSKVLFKLSSLESNDQTGADLMRFENIKAAELSTCELSNLYGNGIATGEQGPGTPLTMNSVKTTLPNDKAVFANFSGEPVPVRYSRANNAFIGSNMFSGANLIPIASEPTSQ